VTRLERLRRVFFLFVAGSLLSFCGLTDAVEPAIKLGIEKRGDAFILDTVIDFPVSVRTAWDVLTDFDHMVGVLNGLTASKITKRNENTMVVQQSGVAKFGIFSYAFASEREIRLDPMKRIQATQLSGNAKQFVSDLELTPAGDKSQARYHAEVTPDSGIERTFGGSFIEHEVEEQFAAMVAEMTRRKMSGPENH